MYTACFTVPGGACTQDYIFSGDTLMDVMDRFNDVQEIMRFAGLAMQEEDADDPNVRRLARFAGIYSSGKVRGRMP